MWTAYALCVRCQRSAASRGQGLPLQPDTAYAMRMTTTTYARTESDLASDVIIEISAMIGRRRMNQAALARALDVKPMWVSDRMTGRVRLTLDDLARIADALNVGIVDLLPRDRRMPTLTLADSPSVTGTWAWPEHPIVAGAVRIPQQRRPLEHGPPDRSRKTSPTGR